MDVFQCDTFGGSTLRVENRDAERRSTLENPRVSLQDPEAWDEAFGDGLATSGVRINRDTALKLSGFLRGVHLIAARIAELPIYVYREKAADSYAIDRTHPANKCIRLEAISGEMSAMTFKHTLQGHALTHGNGFGYAPQNGRGEVQELLPLLPDRTRLTRINGRLQYVTSIGGTLDDPQSELRYLDPDEVIHIKGLGWDGYTGYSVLRMGREVLGGAIATQQFGNSYYRNSAMTGMVIETDQALSDTAYARMRTLYTKTRAGLSNAHKAAILEEGAKAKWPVIAAADAQLLESKRFDLTLIEHLLGLPPGLLTGRANQRNIESDSIELIDYCLNWWMASWESELSRKLLTTADYESETVKILFDRKGLIRSNLAAQAMWWRTALGGRAWATQLEARQAMGLDPTKGADDILEPLNMGSLQASADGGTFKSQASAREDQDARLRGDPIKLYQTIVRDAVTRMAKRVAKFVERSGRSPNLLAKFDADHVGVIREALAGLSPLTRSGKLDEWFLTTVRAPLQALVDGEPATSPESLATFFDGLPARAAELV